MRITGLHCTRRAERKALDTRESSKCSSISDELFHLLGSPPSFFFALIRTRDYAKQVFAVLLRGVLNFLSSGERARSRFFFFTSVLEDCRDFYKIIDFLFCGERETGCLFESRARALLGVICLTRDARRIRRGNVYKLSVL